MRDSKSGAGVPAGELAGIAPFCLPTKPERCGIAPLAAATVTAWDTLLAGDLPAHTHAESDVTSLATDLTNRPVKGGA